MDSPLLSLSKNKFFDRLAEVKGAVKTSNSHSSAYGDTVECELRSKSKRLRSKSLQAFCKNYKVVLHSV